MAIELDVTDQGSIQRGVARVLADEGKIDILVKNAGLARTTTRSTSPRSTGTR